MSTKRSSVHIDAKEAPTKGQEVEKYKRVRPETAKIKPGRQIGEGGFGQVFKMKFKGQTVAGKHVTDPWETNRTIEEFEMVKKLNRENNGDPHLVKYLDIISEEDHTVWLILEYISGKPLSDFYRHSMFQHGSLFFWRLVHQTSGVFMKMHKLGYIHSDIKPHNIMLRRKRGLASSLIGGINAFLPIDSVVIDLGLMCSLNDKTDDRRMLCAGATGTKEFRSPEAERSRETHEHYDMFSSDVFSLGLTYLYVVGTSSKNMDKNQNELLKHMLNNDPKARPTMQQVNHMSIDVLSA